MSALSTSARAWLKRVLGRFVPATPVVEEWEWYARNHARSASGAPLGDEWNTPEVIGADVDAARLVAHLDEQVFAPFLAPLSPIGTILEIGAGGGRFTEILATKAATVLAGDAAPTMLTLLAARFRDRPGVKPLRLDGRTLAGVGDGAVDAVFSYDVFVHLAAWDTYNYLREIRRVLRPGGRAIVHHGNALSELGWRKFAADAERERQGLPSAGRFPAMTPALMKAMVEHAGLVLVRSEESVVRRDAIALIEKPA